MGKGGGFPEKRIPQLIEQLGLVGKVPSHLGLQEVEKNVAKIQGIQPQPPPDAYVLDEKHTTCPCFCKNPALALRIALPKR